MVKADGYGLGAGAGRPDRLWAEGARSFFVARAVGGRGRCAGSSASRDGDHPTCSTARSGAPRRSAGARPHPVLSTRRTGRRLARRRQAARGAACRHRHEPPGRQPGRGRGDQGVRPAHRPGDEPPRLRRHPRPSAQRPPARALQGRPRPVPARSAPAWAPRPGPSLVPTTSSTWSAPASASMAAARASGSDPRIRAVARLTSPLLQIRHIEAGEQVGYGSSFTAKRPTPIGVVGGGYADGVLRTVFGKATAWLGDSPAPILGRLDGHDRRRPDRLLRRGGRRPDRVPRPARCLDDLAAAAGSVRARSPRPPQPAGAAHLSGSRLNPPWPAKAPSTPASPAAPCTPSGRGAATPAGPGTPWSRSCRPRVRPARWRPPRARPSSASPSRALDTETPTPPRIVTGVEEFDRVCGGGVVPGSAILAAGDPGVGKSTLLLQVCASAALRGASCAYISGEEAIDQVRSRAQRMGLHLAPVKLAAETGLSGHRRRAEARRASTWSSSIRSRPCGATSWRPGRARWPRCGPAAGELVRLAKSRDVAVILVGHVTKDGQVAGPARGRAHGRRRALLRGRARLSVPHPARRQEPVRRHRRDRRVRDVRRRPARGRNPSACSSARAANAPAGSAVLAGIEGSRPVLVEVQALVAPSAYGTPRRAVVGWDSGPPGHGAGRARGALRPLPRQSRRLFERGRRPARHRAGGGPGGGGRPGLLGARPAAAAGTAWCSARSACRARCAPSAAWRRG